MLFHHISSATSSSSHEQRLSASLDEALFSALQGRPSFTSNLSKKCNVTPESEPNNSSQHCQATGTPVMPTGKILVRPLREILHPKTFACQKILPYTHARYAVELCVHDKLYEAYEAALLQEKHFLIKLFLLMLTHSVCINVIIAILNFCCDIMVLSCLS